MSNWPLANKPTAVIANCIGFELNPVSRAMILITFAIYICTARTIYKIRKQVHELDADYNLRSITSSEFISYNGTDSTTRIGNDAVLSVHTRVVYHQTTAIQLAPGGSHRNSRQALARRHSYEHKNAAWSYSKCALLYFTATLITWIPASANRVYSFVHGGQTVATFAYMQSCVVPLQGFWNWIIYVAMSWDACTQLLQDIKDRCLRVCGKRASRTDGAGHPVIGGP